MNKVSLRMGFESQNDWYLSALLGKMGINPNPDYKLSPVYRKAWAMTEAGRLLGEDKEVAHLEKNRQEFEKEQKRLQNDPGHRALIVAEALIRDAVASKVTR